MGRRIVRLWVLFCALAMAAFGIGCGGGTSKLMPSSSVTASTSSSFAAPSSATVTATAPNQPPVAKLAVTPTSGTAPLTVSASTAGSSDPNAGGSITSANINFGDGTTANTASATHTYSSTGTYTVTATVTDNFTLSSTATATVTVSSTVTASVTVTSLANQQPACSAAPNITSGPTATVLSPTSAQVTWTTACLSDTLLYYGPGDGYGYDTGLQDNVTGVTSHSQTVTGLYPGSTYYYGVRSRGFTSGSPDPAKATFSAGYTLTTSAAPNTGSFDYYVNIVGPHHVTQGYEIFVGIQSGVLSGTASAFSYVNYTISGLPPYSALHWPDIETYGVCCAVPTKTVAGDTGQYWSFGNAQFEIVTNVGGTTPTGTYTITLSTSTGSGMTGGPQYSRTWSVVVDAPSALATGTPSSYPAIPNLANWQAQMVYWGEYWESNYAPLPGCEQCVDYYDGTRVMYQIQDYDAAHTLTGNSGQWGAFAQTIRNDYLSYVGTGGAVPGYNRFTQGLYMDYLRTGNAPSKAGVDALASAAALTWLSGGYTIPLDLVRETSYILDAFRWDVKLGASTYSVGGNAVNASVLTKQAVDQLLGHIDQSCISGNNDGVQPFMLGLMADSLIQCYQDSSCTAYQDARIPVAIKTMADWLWTNAWNKDSSTSFYYNSYEYSIGMPESNPMDPLNLLVVPMYAWLFQYTGNPTYQTEGDTIFSDGVNGILGQGVGNSPLYYNGGKIFSQSYRWSFDYVKWRSP